VETYHQLCFVRENYKFQDAISVDILSTILHGISISFNGRKQISLPSSRSLRRKIQGTRGWSSSPPALGM